jgi:hypothetical protein
MVKRLLQILVLLLVSSGTLLAGGTGPRVVPVEGGGGIDHATVSPAPAPTVSADSQVSQSDRRVGSSFGLRTALRLCLSALLGIAWDTDIADSTDDDGPMFDDGPAEDPGEVVLEDHGWDDHKK